MSTFPPEPPTTPGIPGSDGARELTQDEIVKLPMQALLVRLGRMSLEQLAEALRENVATGKPVEQVAVERGWVQAAEVEHLRSTKRALGATVDEPVPVQPAPVQPAPAQPAAAHPASAPFATTAPPAPVAEPLPTASVPAPAPVAATAPAAPAEPAPAPPPQPDEEGAAVFIALSGGQRVRVSTFSSLESCRKRADEVMDVFNRPEPGIWPRFGNRLVRPDAVTAIEISRRRDD